MRDWNRREVIARRGGVAAGGVGAADQQGAADRCASARSRGRPGSAGACHGGAMREIG